MSSQKKSSRLEGKDLITIGIYTVIYVVIVMLVAMLGFIPIFIPLMAVLCPLIGGIPYMLYVTKAKKFGMTAIMGFLIGLMMKMSNSFVRGSSRRPVSAFLLRKISRAIMQYQHAGSAFYKWPFQSDRQQCQIQSKQPAE